MVYGGKPSTGCLQCRRRHIKCDETRPHCRKCDRRGLQCPGYQHPFDLMLRYHTPSLTNKAQSNSVASTGSNLSSNPGHSESVSSQKLVLASSETSIENVELWPQLNTCIPIELCNPVEDVVASLFFNAFLFLPKLSQRYGFMSLLPRLYTDCKPGSYMRYSVMAVAFFSVSVWTGQDSLMRDAHRSFTSSLPKIREALAAEGDLNTVLAGIMCLSMFEELVALRNFQIPARAHLKGAIALINSRRPQNLGKPHLSATLHHAVQTAIIKTTRGLRNVMVPTPTVWPISQSLGPPSPRKVLWQAATRLVHLRDAWERIQHYQPDEAELTSVLERATEVSTDFISWTYSVPSSWKPVAADLIPQSVRDAGVFRDLCDCYRDMWVAATWNTFRDCMILVQKIILSCLMMLPFQDPGGRRIAEARAMIQSMANEMCAAVPYFLGSLREAVPMKSGLIEYPISEAMPITLIHQTSAPLMGGWHVVVSMRNLQSPELELPPDQVRWVDKQLDRVRRIYFRQ